MTLFKCGIWKKKKKDTGELIHKTELDQETQNKSMVAQREWTKQAKGLRGTNSQLQNK